jgi:hypothetical protein
MTGVHKSCATRLRACAVVLWILGASIACASPSAPADKDIKAERSIPRGAPANHRGQSKTVGLRPTTVSVAPTNAARVRSVLRAESGAGSARRGVGRITDFNSAAISGRTAAPSSDGATAAARAPRAAIQGTPRTMSPTGRGAPATMGALAAAFNSTAMSTSRAVTQPRSLNMTTAFPGRVGGMPRAKTSHTGTIDGGAVRRRF